jgi:hypothetical protein
LRANNEGSTKDLSSHKERDPMLRDWRRHANCKSPRSYGVGEVLGGWWIRWWTLEENVNESVRDFQHLPPRSLVVTVLIGLIASSPHFSHRAARRRGSRHAYTRSPVTINLPAFDNSRSVALASSLFSKPKLSRARRSTSAPPLSRASRADWPCCVLLSPRTP